MFFFCFLVIEGQNLAPDGNDYDSKCVNNSDGESNDEGLYIDSSIAWFNDSGNCGGTEWYIRYYFSDGTHLNLNSPSGGYYMDFDSDPWDCCDEVSSSGSGTLDICDCTWAMNSAGVIIIDCPCNPQ